MIRDILSIRKAECRYCITDDTPFLFCGDPVAEGSSYCEDHHELCHAGEGRNIRDVESMIHSVDHSAANRVATAPVIVPVDVQMRGVK